MPEVLHEKISHKQLLHNPSFIRWSNWILLAIHPFSITVTKISRENFKTGYAKIEIMYIIFYSLSSYKTTSKAYHSRWEANIEINYIVI